VTGDANKEIALKLNRSEVSVERAVTSLLRKSKCAGRARLVATFWQAPLARRESGASARD